MRHLCKTLHFCCNHRYLKMYCRRALLLHTLLFYRNHPVLSDKPIISAWNSQSVLGKHVLWPSNMGEGGWCVLGLSVSLHVRRCHKLRLGAGCNAVVATCRSMTCDLVQLMKYYSRIVVQHVINVHLDLFIEEQMRWLISRLGCHMHSYASICRYNNCYNVQMLL